MDHDALVQAFLEDAPPPVREYVERLRSERDEAQAERDLWADRAMEFEAERNAVLRLLEQEVQAHAKTVHRLEDMAAMLEGADNGR